MAEALEFKTLEGKVSTLEDSIKTLHFQDQILEEKIEGRMAIAEHTNVFLDIVFILMSIVLWVITMQGWRNSKEVETERRQLRDIMERDREEIAKYKQMLEQDRANFTSEYEKVIEETVESIAINKKKVEEGYRIMEEKYAQIIKDIKGVSEYYLELVAISHEPDLGERVFEYERILKNSEKYDLSEEEKARLYYYLSITLYQLATKTPDAKSKLVLEWIRKASKYISSSITLGGKKGVYFYEKAKIEFEKYRLELVQTNDFSDFVGKIYEIEEYFEIAFSLGDVEFYMFEEMLYLFYDIIEKIATKESDKRVLYDLMMVWCERAKAFDVTSYKEDLEELREEISEKIKNQNLKLNDN